MLLESQCKLLAPRLYRSHALYLQVLRSLLKDATRKALFNLITFQDPSIFNSVSSQSRKDFQLKVDQLVDKCNSLLTVEHLMDLARQIDQDKKRLIDDANKEIFAKTNLQENRDSSKHMEDSIDLSLSLPVDSIDQLDRWMTDDQFGGSIDFYAKPSRLSISYVPEGFMKLTDLEPPKDLNSVPEDPYGAVNDEILSEGDLIQASDEMIQDRELDVADSSQDKELEKIDSSKNGLDVLKNLLLMAGDVIWDKPSKALDQNDPVSTSSEPFDTNESHNNRLLPQTPIEMNLWLDSLEEALAIRLRNLSHAINVELLRSGIVTSLLPITLLDAALAGQVNSEDNSSNLLRMSLPISKDFSDGININCLLIRSSDLEFDEPKLRNCRSQLRKIRNILLKMVRQQRHWQSRSIANELHEQWWQQPQMTQKNTNPPLK